MSHICKSSFKKSKSICEMAVLKKPKLLLSNDNSLVNGQLVKGTMASFHSGDRLSGQQV